jgi:hypothetical protein
MNTDISTARSELAKARRNVPRKSIFWLPPAQVGDQPGPLTGRFTSASMTGTGLPAWQVPLAAASSTGLHRWPLDLERLKFSILASVDEELAIAAAAARCGLPESTLRYWEQVGLISPVRRDASSRHRRYREEDVALLETLATCGRSD